MWKMNDLVKERQVQELKMQNETAQQTQNVFASAMLEQEQHRQDVQSSRFTFWGIARKDSPAMVSFKECVGQVTDFMRTTMPSEEEAFKTQLRELLSRYDKLVESCKEYISTHSDPHTASGKERLRMVRNTLRMARLEHKTLTEKARELHRYGQQTNQHDLVWGNVLGLIRESELNLDKADQVEQGGAGTSELLIITIGNQKVFYKEDERLQKPSEEIERQYIQNCQNKQDKAIYQELKNLMPDTVKHANAAIFNNTAIRNGILSQDPQQQNDAYQEIQNMLEALDVTCTLDWKDERVRRIMRELMPRYSKWLTRSFICGFAQIDSGNLLSTRNVATSRMAELLHIQNMVAASRQVYMVDRATSSVRTGIAMAQAVGKDYGEITTQATNDQLPLIHSPEAVRQLVCLQMLDVLCGQVDRNKSNIFATQTNENGTVVVTGIQAIDNDLSFGTISYEELNRTADGVNMLPVFEKDGLCTIPALDGNMTAALLALSDEVVRFTMQDLLNEAEIDALVDRLHGMQNTIRASLEANPDLVVATDEWNAETAERFKVSQVNKAYADFHLGGL